MPGKKKSKAEEPKKYVEGQGLRTDDAKAADMDSEELQKKLEQAKSALADAEKSHEDTKSKLSEAERQRDERNDALLRLRADFDNYRKRNAQLRTEALTEGKIEIILNLLKSIDNFERALQVECSDTGYADGMKMIYNMLMSALHESGLEEIDATGQFDPNFHEAVMQEETEDAESGKIVLVLQKGYMLSGKVIRPAMVKVAK